MWYAAWYRSSHSGCWAFSWRRALLEAQTPSSSPRQCIQLHADALQAQQVPEQAVVPRHHLRA